MRIVLHTGKGGVGKTTIATATAIAAARSGHRTLLLSTDPAHSVADVLDIPLGADPLPVVGVEGLWAAQVDVRARFEQAWSAVRSYLVGVLAAQGVAGVQAEELVVLPGAEEIVALLELHRHAESGDFDVLVVDCAPTGETLRLLALPETLSFYATKVMGAPARLMRSLAAGLAGITGGRAPAAPGVEVRDALTDLLDRLGAARRLLTDPEVSAIRLVITPERVVIAEARRLWTALSLHGFAVDAVIVNRLLPDDLPGEFAAAWRASQELGLHLARESFLTLPMHRVQLSAAEPVGVDAVGRLAGELFAGSDPVARRLTRPGISTVEVEGGYQLRLPLPLLDRGSIDLSRAGDDLVITIGPQRRRLSLPSVLRRCAAVGARFDEDELMIEFEPDPSLWPAVLPFPSSATEAGEDLARAQ